jgi:hypothetical protein
MTPIVDVHQHSGPWPYPGRFKGPELNQYYLEKHGFAAAIVSSTEAVVMDMVAGNAALAEALADYPNLYGYVTVNANDLAGSCREMDRYYATGRFVGAKFHSSYARQPIAAPKSAELVAAIAERGRPALVHTWGAGEVRALAALARRHPNWSVIMAHSGGAAWREAIEEAGQTPNLYLDFCTSTVERPKIQRALQALGPRQVVFGTDATLFDPAYMLGVFQEVEMDEADREWVMGRNAVGLFDLDIA